MTQRNTLTTFYRQTSIHLFNLYHDGSILGTTNYKLFKTHMTLGSGETIQMGSKSTVCQNIHIVE